MIVVFGSINLDLIFPLPHIPAAGETVLTPTLSLSPGGKGANQAVAAARDGADVVMVGAVGGDSLATDALSLLRAASIDLTRVIQTDSTTGTAAIFVNPDGENAIGVGSGANLLARADQVEDALLTPETTLLLQMEVPAAANEALIRRARAHGTRIILNLAPAARVVLDLRGLLDILVVNEGEAGAVAACIGCENTAAALHSVLCCAVVRTLGDRGCEYAGPDGEIRVPATKVLVRDTTAAGDCFSGVLAASLDNGLSMNSALRRANAAAALCCTRPGTQSSLPTRAETDAMLLT